MKKQTSTQTEQPTPTQTSTQTEQPTPTQTPMQIEQPLEAISQIQSTYVKVPIMDILVLKAVLDRNYREFRNDVSKGEEYRDDNDFHTVFYKIIGFLANQENADPEFKKRIGDELFDYLPACEKLMMQDIDNLLEAAMTATKNDQVRSISKARNKSMELLFQELYRALPFCGPAPKALA